MTEPQTPAAEEIFALRSVRDSHVIFSLANGVSNVSRFMEKVGEQAVAIPRTRALELDRMFQPGGDGLIAVGHAIENSRTIVFPYRTVMITPLGHAVLRAAGA